MQSISLKNIVLPLAIIMAGFAAVIGLSGYLERTRPPLPEGYEDSNLTVNGSRLKGFPPSSTWST